MRGGGISTPPAATRPIERSPPSAPIAGCSSSPVSPSRCVRLSSCWLQSRGSRSARSPSPRAHPVGPRALRRLPPLPDVPGRSQLTWKQPRLQHAAVGPLSPPYRANPGSPSHPFPVPTRGEPLARRSCRKSPRVFQGLHHWGIAWQQRRNGNHMRSSQLELGNQKCSPRGCRMHGGVDSTVAMRSSPLLREALTQRANVAAKGVRPDPMEEGSVLPFPFHACTTAESHPLPPHAWVRNTPFAPQIEWTQWLSVRPLAGCHQPKAYSSTEGQRFRLSSPLPLSFLPLFFSLFQSHQHVTHCPSPSCITDGVQMGERTASCTECGSGAVGHNPSIGVIPPPFSPRGFGNVGDPNLVGLGLSGPKVLMVKGAQPSADTRGPTMRCRAVPGAHSHN